MFVDLPLAPEAQIHIHEGEVVWRWSPRSGRNRNTVVGHGHEISYWLNQQCVRRFVLPKDPEWTASSSELQNLWFSNARFLPPAWGINSENLQFKLVIRGQKPACCIRISRRDSKKFIERIPSKSFGYFMKKADSEEGYNDLYIYNRFTPMIESHKSDRVQNVLDMWRCKAFIFRKNTTLSSSYSVRIPDISIKEFIDQPLDDAVRKVIPVLEKRTSQQEPVDLIRCALFLGYPLSCSAALIWFRRLKLITPTTILSSDATP
jgi:hypothetical protein